MLLLVVMPALFVLVVVAVFRIFEKAGQPGWAAIVPFYNMYVTMKVVGRPGWWLALMFVPGLNIVVMVIVAVDLAQAFGKGGGFAAVVILLPFVGLPVLGLGSAVYHGPVADPAFRFYGYPGYPRMAPAYPGY